MKKISLIALLILCITFIAGAQKKVAVYVTGDQETGVKKVLGSKMVTYITESEDFTAIERTADFLAALREEQDHQLSGEVSNSQIVKLGQQFGARYVAVVDVTELYGELFISSRLIDVQTAQVDASFEASGRGSNLNELSNLANKIADGLILAPERKRNEIIQQQRQREEEALRERALANLIPSDAIQCGNYIVLNRKFYFRPYYNASKQRIEVEFAQEIPNGFRTANTMDLEYLIRNFVDNHSSPVWSVMYDLINKYEIIPGYPNSEPPLVSRTTNNRGKKDEEKVFRLYGYNGNSQRYIGKIYKVKDGWEHTINTNPECYSIVVRNAPTEEEIQAEMRRLSR